ncbi:DUF2790 domain-containing protein [Pseudomonas nitroreducens]|uniref:DUF2790 domain-containing protein n=1 Tax=Pseudomonas nitroreducens TaxID=46680 RepID=A0ABS0KP26_PSENT|nr:DUF2790 domain-containing protein [Pseudomonas nitroreducens]MBG6289837.1 DUF2790 domain-containing protein [Pseudomonas nitroreducens]MDG9857358.1 DUF2790 domain-containing protein [Pseudomonas nitroreducens]MDH1076548.1 DUF2790 domain-containing protein [Pseudomonas nitroreducens]
MSKSSFSKAAGITVVFLLSQAFFASAQAVPEDYVQRMEALNDQAVRQHAEAEGKAIPAVEDYRFGMKMDVAKVIHVTPTASANLCGNVPKLMSYEDSAGELKTIRYTVNGNCRNER